MKTLLASATFVAAFAICACGGGDPGAGNSLPGQGDAGYPALGPPSSSGHSGSTDSGAPAAAHDAGPPADPDPPVPGTLVHNPQDTFSGAPPYASAPPSLRANDNHAGVSVTGKPCLSCHDGTTCAKFDFAGTVWRSPGLTQPAADAEVRIIDANNYAHSVHSDADGNFWHRATKDLAMPALSGVRTSSWHALGQLNGTSCNTCHEDGKPLNPGRLFVQQ